MAPFLPSRYEDLDRGFRGRLRPNAQLIGLVKQAFQSMEVSGGIRFLPMYGESGSGKSSAAIELGTHLPELKVVELSRAAVESSEHLNSEIKAALRGRAKGLVVVIDQYEEVAAQKSNIPTAFVESIALMDRRELRNEKILFLWLTTSRDFQKSLSDATSRNRRILLEQNFELLGPERTEWSAIINDTFQFHNSGKSLADYEVLDADLEEYSQDPDLTLGTCIENIGTRLGKYTRSLHDLSTYQVVMLWPVTDGHVPCRGVADGGGHRRSCGRVGLRQPT